MPATSGPPQMVPGAGPVADMGHGVSIHPQFGFTGVPSAPPGSVPAVPGASSTPAVANVPAPHQPSANHQPPVTHGLPPGHGLSPSHGPPANHGLPTSHGLPVSHGQPQPPPPQVNQGVAPQAQMTAPGNLTVDSSLEDDAVEDEEEHVSKRQRLEDIQEPTLEDEAVLHVLSGHNNSETPDEYTGEYEYGDA
jgi:hypothetical protein